MGILNVNTDELVVLTNKLEKLHRSAFPVAVRGTLNRAAFHTKSTTLQIQAKKTFINRTSSFFRAFSGVDTAKGFDLERMEATTGIIQGSGTAKQATKNMRKQERGGTIKGRSFIAMDTSRTSKSRAKNVRKIYRTDKLKFRTRAVKQRDKSVFFATVRKEKEGGFMIYNGVVFFIRSIKKNNVKLVPIYSFKKGRSVRVSATKFVEKASLQSQKRMNRWYQIQAKKQFNKALGI